MHQNDSFSGIFFMMKAQHTHTLVENPPHVPLSLHQKGKRESFQKVWENILNQLKIKINHVIELFCLLLTISPWIADCKHVLCSVCFDGLQSERITEKKRHENLCWQPKRYKLETRVYSTHSNGCHLSVSFSLILFPNVSLILEVDKLAPPPRRKQP